MHSEWIEERQLARALERHRAFWGRELEGMPLLWITVPDATPGEPPPEPESEEERWTDVDYAIAAAEHSLSHTYYAGDALPVHNPWLGPNQFAAWLGTPMVLKPRQSTSWTTPVVDDWSRHERFSIDPENRWWKLYFDLVRRSVQAGRGKWVTAYPDLHTGIDALSALRGTRELLLDLVTDPDAVRRAMRAMTALFKEVVDAVSAIILPAGQGTSNWTMGWSDDRFLCIGQNDFTCMISPAMFADFCLEDTRETCACADRSIYHLDGPGAVRHLDAILAIERLDCIQWIQGAGNPPPSRWIPLLRRIQDAGKSVQVYYGPHHGDDADKRAELEILCRELDPRRLFFWAVVPTVEEADDLVARAEKLCCRRRA